MAEQNSVPLLKKVAIDFMKRLVNFVFKKQDHYSSRFSSISNIKEIVKVPDWPGFVDDYPNLLLEILNPILLVKLSAM